MLVRISVAFFIIAVLGLAFAVAVSPVSPAAAPARAPSPPSSLAASRLFVLLPDGRVEVSDGPTRRVFRWDGRRWVEAEAVRPTSSGDRQ
jgi:hypothetical protein